jgi:tetratricopeptide (TPR) repeat protein
MKLTVRQGLVLAGSAAALAAAVAVQVARDRAYPREERALERFLYIRSGAAMQRLALSYDALAADVYWLRTIQHYGGDRLERGRAGPKYELLYPLLDLTTTLDPYFQIAYRFGAVFLAEPYPGGPGRADRAIALLRKAMAANPQKWEYPHDTAFVYFWRLNDHAAAARWFQRAADLPGAPPWLRPLAAAVLAGGGDREASRFLWRQMLSAEQVWMRRAAERSLLQLDALDLIDAVQAAVRAAGPPPDGRYSWIDLTHRGVLRGIPVDPTGGPLEIDPVTGDVAISTQSPLYPMPVPMRRSRQ